ncbi:hypothetical protein [Clostridium beijerinckii]|uniref:Uncharacterized protein n=1 Tax=Clostridium beijerinckii TaxID=1520 RepID=A0A9Q5CWX8_CLOBE|nr:hypothetical protein [Clostridium beijerinckii]AQS05550.1 hypothetical protein CLBIJ_29830 [Clostridium beijerinckii]MBA2884947.1 hypothetical protein [Clostridium beijerinckii]MBA2899679.1 hypothetical protein [Clostridium beijerinckii]MBA2909298.1 hypothetical protein [Clostridium beijerinckii]MBA9014871.1 hypothetical protein [Clostridium beijerinckii]
MGYEEEKRERFIRIAEKRTNKILEGLRLLGNCSNKSNYEYSDEDIKKIFNTIEQELKITKYKFYSKENKSNKFTL